MKVFLLCLLLLSSGVACADDTLTQKLEKKYFDTLDAWVKKGGPRDEIQETVIGTCGKLVMNAGSAAEKTAFLTTDRESFDFRVDVCFKMTVNRVYPQPEFKNPETTKIICDGDTLDVFRKLCKRSGLR